MSYALIPESESRTASLSGFTCAYINCCLWMYIETSVIPHHRFKSLSIWWVEGRGTTHKSRQSGKTHLQRGRPLCWAWCEDFVFYFWAMYVHFPKYAGNSTPASFFLFSVNPSCTGTPSEPCSGYASKVKCGSGSGYVVPLLCDLEV